jgi:ABC-type transporter Mla subunit MlaD
MSVARPWIKRAVILGVIVVAGILIWSSGDSELIIFGKEPSYPHYLNVTVPSAFEAADGQRVTEGGEGIGTIVEANVTKSAQAHLRLGISAAAWPIPLDSQFTLRMGGTIKYTDRFISITKGNASHSFIDNQSIPAKQFTVPVEYDQVFNVFNASTRKGLSSFFQNTAHLAPAATPFRHAISPPTASAVGQAAAVFTDLSSEDTALSTLISSTATISDAVQQANPGVQTLLTGAASTFGTIASQSTQLQQIITPLGHAFQTFGNATFNLAAELYKVRPVVVKLNPAITQLDDLSTPVNDTLREVVNVEPTAVSTLKTVSSQGPRIDTLLTSARTKLLPQLATVANQAVPMLDCIRPYTPDVVSFLQQWASYFGDGYNTPHVNVLNALIDILPFPAEMPIDSAQMHAIFPNLHIEFPAAPGTRSGEPWYQPQCDITPADDVDPESHTFDPRGAKVIPYGPTTSPDYGPTNIP